MSTLEDEDAPPELVPVAEGLSINQTRRDEPDAEATGSKGEDNALPSESDHVSKVVPVTIISGFLGAGKTTLLNWILTQPHGYRIAVIENEFGRGLGIETAIAKDGTDGSNLEGIFELSNGCICCSVKSDLVTTLELLIERKSKFDYILIECSGLADPGPVASCLWVDAELESQLRLDGIVTVVDAKHIRRHLQVPSVVGNGDAGGNQQACCTEEAIRQICVADRILLNKSDTVSTHDLSSLEAILQSLNGVASIQRTQYSRVDMGFILGLDSYGALSEVGELPRWLQAHMGVSGAAAATCHDGACEHNGEGEACHHLDSHQHSLGVMTVAVDDQELEVTQEGVNRWMAELLWSEDDAVEAEAGGGDGDAYQEAEGHHVGIDTYLLGNRCKRPLEVYRVKGVLAMKDDPEGVYILQAVHETFEVEKSSTLRWGSDGGVGERGCRIVAIGRGIAEATIREGLRGAGTR